MTESESVDVREQLQSALGDELRLGRELGGGGMSRVFIAEDTKLGRDVVVKVLSPTLAQEFSLERFTREIKLAANLQQAHIVPLLSAGATERGLPYYIMPYVEGESLRHRLKSGSALSIEETILVLKDVCRALAYAHARGVVHRDIKPDNVMLSNGAAVVTDFGIAKAVTSARESRVADSTESLTRMGTSLGTPAYMAPEQGAGDPDTDHRADIYALGAMAYELLTCKTPFGERAPHALLVAHFTEIPTPVSVLRPDTPPALADLVMTCLSKDPADRPQSATEVLAALSDVSATGAVKSMDQIGTAHSKPTTRSNTRTLVVAAAVLAAISAASYVVWQFFSEPPGLERTLIAVMPFNVREQSLNIWSEGMVDVLSRSLDGAGSLRTLAPSTSISNSPDRADAVSAKSLGQNMGAGLVLFGDLSSSGPDSVHLRAAIFDVADNRVKYNIELVGEADRMDALADSLSLRVLRQLGAEGGLGASPLYAVGTRSLPALKAFLQGQQFYRRAVMDSALSAYQSAVEIDSTFALAWRGIASYYIRRGQENDPQAQAALERAIANKSGRSPRDSLVLRADSLRLAIVRTELPRTQALAPVNGLSDLLSTLTKATQTYPNDAELWFELGDARFHFGELDGVPQTATLAAFERGISIDSSFSVPYFHSLDLALRLGDTGKAASLTRRLSTMLSGDAALFYKLTSTMLESAPDLSAESRSLVDTLPGRYLASVITTLATARDSGGLALKIVERAHSRTAIDRNPADSGSLAQSMAFALAARGKFAASMKSVGRGAPQAMMSLLAQLGAVPLDSAVASIRELSKVDPAQGLQSLSLLSRMGDTTALGAIGRWVDSAARTLPAGSPSSRAAQARASEVRAFTLLARGDSSGALDTLLSIPVAYCRNTPCVGDVSSRLLVAAGRDREAAQILDRWMPSYWNKISIPEDWLMRGKIAERLHDEDAAAKAYLVVLTMWRGGDATTQRAVLEAQEGLRRIRR